MANSDRRSKFRDRSGNMFIPMNVEGGGINDRFFTTPKIVTLAIEVVTFILYLTSAFGSEGGMPLKTKIIYFLLWLVACTYATRFIIFEEKFYYRMYKELQKYEITTPALFWDISSIKNTEAGAILTYSDARIGIIVKLYRGTIIGKPKGSREAHYDAISDFYRDLVSKGYSFVQMNIMEPAGKDPRLASLSKLMTESPNPRIRMLMEMEIGHIKNITNVSLYESDYFLVYSQNSAKIDSIIDDVTDSFLILLDGAYVGYDVVDYKEIVGLVKELEGVTYFDATEASMLQFENSSISNIHPFVLTGIVWDDDYRQEFDKAELPRLRRLTSDVIRGTKKLSDVSLKDTFYKKKEEKNIGVDLDSILEQHGNPQPVSSDSTDDMSIDDAEELISFGDSDSAGDNDDDVIIDI